jgi:uncharacterized membrane protein YoaT (DUF817 family)
MADSAPQRADSRPAVRAPNPTPFMPLEAAPPLSGLAALAAFAAMLLNQVLLPGLGTDGDPTLLSRLARAGQFAANLAVFCGVIALTLCAVEVARGQVALVIRRRVLWAILTVVLLRAALIATLFERGETTRENVYLAVGAANLLGVLAGVYAFERTRGSWLRVLAVFATALPMFSVVAVLLELTDVQLDPWKRRGYEWALGLGELSYVGLLFASVPVLVSRGLRLRDLIARSFGLAVLVASLYALRTAQAALHNDYPVLFYHAQRVGLLLDRWPLAYAVPFCLALSAIATAMVGAANSARWQAACGMLLLFAAGYTPKAPGRLLSLALGFVLLSRALSALKGPAESPDEARG